MYRRIELYSDDYSHDWLTLMGALCESGLPGQNGSWKHLENKSARFFFTEEGWRKFGHKTLSVVRREGYIAKVTTLKESDPRLNVIYRDRWQVNVRFGGRPR